MPKTKTLNAKLRCKECESSRVEVLEVKQGANQGRRYAVCDNGCTSINKGTGKRGKRWVGWMPELDDTESERSPSPPPRQKPSKKQKTSSKKEEQPEEQSDSEGLEMDAVTIRLEELKNGQRQLQDELRTVSSRLLQLYTKMPTASQWPTGSKSSYTQPTTTPPSEQLGNVLASQKTSAPSPSPLFNLSNISDEYGNGY